MMRSVIELKRWHDLAITEAVHLFCSARTPKRIREALNDFALVCRGLAGTVYGNATTV
jgi:hypothetical protein